VDLSVKEAELGVDESFNQPPAPIHWSDYKGVFS